jgi:alanyl-tRNA synthetase
VKTKGKEQYHLVFDRTPFYAESGGQVGDSGSIESVGEVVRIHNTFKENNLIIHLADKLPVNLNVEFTAHVDLAKRLSTANNHTATHLLHHSLREVLGSHVEQKGSLVHPDYLRFDFAHFQKMTDEEIREVEKRVNFAIRQNALLNEHRDVPMDEARHMGAIALFGEKYGESVRVIKFGESVELCGGTHVSRTGDIGLFKIISEGAISAGVRRIEAITASKAEEFLYEQVESIKQVKSMLGNTPNFIQGIEKLIEENETLKKQVEELVKEKLKSVKAELKAQAKNVDGKLIIASKVDVGNADVLKDLSYQLRNETENLFLVLGAEIAGKPLLSVMISNSLVDSLNLNASTIIREAAKEIQGGGGGQPFYATAGGKNLAGLDAAIAKALEVAKII